MQESGDGEIKSSMVDDFSEQDAGAALESVDSVVKFASLALQGIRIVVEIMLLYRLFNLHGANPGKTDGVATGER